MELKPKTYALMLVIITGISLWDAWLVVEYSESINYHELNPMGIMLLEIDQGDIDLLVSVKLFGTSVVLYILLILQRYYRRAMIVTTFVTMFQVGLLMFLEFA